jgi:hypothetical protein
MFLYFKEIVKSKMKNEKKNYHKKKGLVQKPSLGLAILKFLNSKE